MDPLAHEDAVLAPFAMRGRNSRGRHYPEPLHAYRSIYQRDRERIVHCTAFRRLVGKTQVLVGRINDHHRTRLTHTLEVAQISRTIARRLAINEDLVEAIALVHDVGHPPFGHMGEAVLNECLAEQGGFDHNLYGLRRVDLLEDRYPEFPGLNLSFELREAFVQHAKRREHPITEPFRTIGSPLLEAQLVDAADGLAYATHDLDDALGIGLIALDELEDLAIWRRAAQPVRQYHLHLRGDAFRTAVIRELIAWQVADLIAETERRLQSQRIRDVMDVRGCPNPIICFSAELQAAKAELDRFLFARVYRHHQVMRMAEKGRRVLRKLFAEFMQNPELLPERHLLRWEGATALSSRRVPNIRLLPKTREASLERVVADYLAGMTDRFARQEYLRVFQPDSD